MDIDIYSPDKSPTIELSITITCRAKSGILSDDSE